METAHLILRYLHLLGFAGLTFGPLSQLRAESRKVTTAMLHSSWLQLITGIALVGILESQDEEVNLTKISIKLGLVLAVLILQLLWRKTALSNLKYTILTLLIMTTSIVAVFV